MTKGQSMIGIMGGSGLYEIPDLKKVEELTVKTPFGNPSDRLLIRELNGVQFVFLPRHGRGHVLAPSEINYRANIFAMKKLGVEYLFSFSAVGSMKENIAPGNIVIVDQFIDCTKGIRKHTFFEKGIVAHISFGNPVCDSLSEVAAQSAKRVTGGVHVGGTYL